MITIELKNNSIDMKVINKQKASRTTSRKEYKVITQDLKDWYWDEGVYYPNQTKNRQNKRLLRQYEIRMYKTWKHNRKKQWKVNN